LVFLPELAKKGNESAKIYLLVAKSPGANPNNIASRPKDSKDCALEGDFGEPFMPDEGFLCRH
jgi:hypothetical protein